MEAIKQLGQQRRRVPQRQLGHHLREPDRPDQLAVDLPAAGHPLRPHLHLRQDGGQHPPRGRPAGRHGDHLRRLGGLHQLRRAPAEPGRGRRRGALERGQHRGQGGALRRHHHRPVRGGLDQHLDRLGRRLLRLVHPHRRLRPADRHDARGGDPGRHRERPLHHPHLRHHRRVHRRPDDRANAGVPGQEDPGHGGETGRPGGPGHADHRAHLHRHRRVDPRRPGRPAQRRAPRVHRDPLRPHLAGEQQRLGLRRPDRQHHLLQRHRRPSTC